MKITNQDIRDQVGRNLKTLMRLAEVDNPNQFANLTDKITVDQVRNIMNAKSGASVDAIQHLADALGVTPSLLLMSEEVRTTLDSDTADVADLDSLFRDFVRASQKGRKLILDVAANAI